MTLNLRKLLSISTQLTFEACRIIHDSWTNHTYQSFFKGPDDLVTDVHISLIQTDYQVQSMMVHGLNLHFPNLKIIGEETE